MFEYFFVVRSSATPLYPDVLSDGCHTGLRLRYANVRKNFDPKRLPSNIAYLVLSFVDSSERLHLFFRTSKRSQPVKVTFDGESMTAELTNLQDLFLAAKFADIMGLPLCLDPVERALIVHSRIGELSELLGVRIFDFGWLRFHNVFEGKLDSLRDGEVNLVGLCKRDNRYLVLARTSSSVSQSRKRKY